MLVNGYGIAKLTAYLEGLGYAPEFVHIWDDALSFSFTHEGRNIHGYLTIPGMEIVVRDNA